MKANYAACAAFTFRYEGGFTNHPADPGGATNWGVTRAVLAAYRGKPVSVADVKAMPKSEAEAIYKRNYWDVIGGDALPVGVDLVAFDLAINSGPGRARQYLDAIKGNPETVIKGICARRLNMMRGLKTWPVFGKGWSARVNACQAVALHMIGK